MKNILQWLVACFIAFGFWHVALHVYSAAHVPNSPFAVVAELVGGKINK